MSVIAIILLILLGIVLLLIEFTIIPGITIAGIGGFLCVIAAVFIAFSQYGNAGGLLTILGILLISPVFIYYLFKSNASKRIILSTKIDSKVEYFNLSKIKSGSKGITLGRLAPSGKVKVNGEVVEAHSNGQMIDENTEITVVKINSNHIIVEPFKE